MEKTVERLVQEAIPVIKKVIEKYFSGFYGECYDDMYSVGLIAAWHAAQAWKPQLSKWKTWAGNRIRWRITDWLRDQAGTRRTQALPKMLSLDAMLEGTDMELRHGSVEDQRAEQPEVPLRRQESRQGLRRALGAQACVLEALLDGNPIREAMAELGCCESRISQIKGLLFERIREEPYLQELLRV